ncbi:MAG: thioredoxin domain-containing protein, partial [Gillisia sp.]|nr:thioredoxin domain-containing protein [Gillisia sp.]
KNILQPDGSLHHSFKNGESRINGYLEDYAFVSAAFLNLYQVTLDKKWLETSKELADYSIDHFYDNKVELFYFTSNKDRPLITRNIDTTDNVIPSSNSVMAKNLFILSKYFENEDLLKLSKNMLSKINGQIKEYPQGHSNWLDLKLNFTNAFYEIVVTGENAVEIINELNSSYLPNTIIDGTVKEDNSRPLTKNRFKSGEDLIYVCTDGTCQLPVHSVRECLKLIKYL